MSTTKNSLDAGLQELRTLRDEIRVQLHLAGLEARDFWERHLEPYVERIEGQLHHVTDAGADALRETIERAAAAFREFRAQLPPRDDEPDFASIPRDKPN